MSSRALVAEPAALFARGDAEPNQHDWFGGVHVAAGGQRGDGRRVIVGATSKLNSLRRGKRASRMQRARRRTRG